MDDRFVQFVERLGPLLQDLMGMSPTKIGALPKNVPGAGVYLFSEGNDHLYVGRSNRIRQRLREHSRPSSTHNTAPFAFRLARESTGRSSPSYTADGSRTDLSQNAAFDKAFSAAKKRVRAMDVRFVEVTDPLEQALLEIYVAVVLDTPHNDFGTH
jgi:hypothetical protein